MPLLVRLVALVALALFALSVHAHRGPHRDAVAKHRRNPSSLSACRPRPTSSVPTPPPAPTCTVPTTTTTTPPPPPPTSAAPSATPAVQSPSSAITPQKWGLAWGTTDDYLPNFVRPGVKYFYNWNENLPDNLRELGLSGMPMLWGDKNAEAFGQTVTKGYADLALFVNEPEQSSQANMSPSHAVGLWWGYMEPLQSLGYTLISAACTDSDAGMEWQKEFFAQCSNCNIHAMAVHVYNTNFTYVANYLNQLHDTFNLPMMITEFADQNFSGSGDQATMDEVWAFATEMKTFVEATEWILCACPFGIMDYLDGVNQYNSLLGPNGFPTSLGYYYFG